MDVSPQDVNQVVRVLAGLAAQSNLETRARKLQLVQGLCEIMGADIYMWTQIQIDPNGRPAAYSSIDGGWISQQQRADFIGFVASSIASVAEANMFARLGNDKFFIAPLVELAPPSDPAFDGCRALGVEPGLLGCYRVSPTLFSGMGFHRHHPPAPSAAPPPPMGPREVAIATLLLSHVDALHTDGTDSPVTDRMSDLTERQRTVLLLLLGGESRKQIARQLKLSEYTVADYIQALYRIFNVSSRAELMYLFLSGKTTAALATPKTDQAED